MGGAGGEEGGKRRGKKGERKRKFIRSSLGGNVRERQGNLWWPAA